MVGANTGSADWLAPQVRTAVGHLTPGAIIDITPVEIEQEIPALGDCVRGTRCQCTVARASIAVPDGVANASIKVVGEDVELQEPNARIELLENPAPVFVC